jgi:hypothetical protein
VDLTANEVRNAVDWIPTDLFVVDHIDVTEVDGIIRTRGGRARRWADWTPAADALEPTKYSYLLRPIPLYSTHPSRSSTRTTDTVHAGCTTCGSAGRPPGRSRATGTRDVGRLASGGSSAFLVTNLDFVRPGEIHERGHLRFVGGVRVRLGAESEHPRFLHHIALRVENSDRAKALDVLA